MSQAVHGGDIISAAKRFGYEPDSVSDFSANINPWATGLSFSELPASRAEINRYPEAFPYSVRRRMAETYNLGEELILPTAGAIEALYLVVRLFSTCSVAVVEPGFGDYQRACRATGLRPDSVTLSPDEWHAPLAELSPRLRDYDVILMGNPNNPTGAWHPIEEWLQLFQEGFSERSIWIVDEAFVDFVPNACRHSLVSVLEELPNLIVIRSLTKSWAVPGLRLGFAATANREWRRRLSEMQPPWPINTIAEEWSRRYLKRSAYQDLLTELAQSLPKVREQFRQGLNQIPGIEAYASWTNFFVVDLDGFPLGADAVYRRLVEKGFLVRCCDSFNGVPSDRFIRVAVKRSDENGRFVDALRAISRESCRSEQTERSVLR